MIVTQTRKAHCFELPTEIQTSMTHRIATLEFCDRRVEIPPGKIRNGTEPLGIH